MNIRDTKLPRIVIAGGGFAGLEVAKKLRNQACQVVLIDRHNFFTFQPLLYQVASAGLEPNSVAHPIRRLFRDAPNVHFRMAEIEAVEPYTNKIYTSIGSVEYDCLVLATGSRPNFFGLDQRKLLAIKTLTDALDMRNWILTELEKACRIENEIIREELVNIVIVGAGPTGVELAGAFAEMKKLVLPKDYPEVNFDRMHIYLLEGMNRVLPAMSKEASEKAHRFLEELGVEILLNEKVVEYDGTEVQTNDKGIHTRNLIWTAGVEGAAVAGLAENSFFRKSRRLLVDEVSRVKGYDNIFAVGDVAAMVSEAYPKGHPMIAPVAMQQGRHLGENLLKMLENELVKPFEYLDKGTLATIGRNRAVADLRRWKLQGTFAWFFWMAVHLMSLVGFRNKLMTFINWFYGYFSYDRALRLIIPRKKTVEKTGTPVSA